MAGGEKGAEKVKKEDKEHTRTHPTADSHTAPDPYPRKVGHTRDSNPSYS